jgi:hypothetical protein
MDDKRIKKFNRLVIKLFLAIGITCSSLAIIAELSGYAFIPYDEAMRYTLYRHYNFLTKTIDTFNAIGYLGMRKINAILGIPIYTFRYDLISCLTFFVSQIIFYLTVGWITATLIFSFKSSK